VEAIREAGACLGKLEREYEILVIGATEAEAIARAVHAEGDARVRWLGCEAGGLARLSR